MKSTNIEVFRKNNAYLVPVITDNGSFLAKFDTGASKTIISADVILGELSDEQRDELNQYCSKRCSFESFSSASGHKFLAYPVKLNKAIIGNVEFESFYYYIVIDKLYDDRKIALLGDDFIDCCGIEKQPHGNIIISCFDNDNYKIQAESISTDELFEIV